MLDALDYSHRAGIIHRDIKPANVMLTPNGDVKVMDFGIARAIADSSATMTQTAAVVGTAQYLSPEQARGEQVDARSDLYSTGCLLFELLTGRPPFVGDSPVSVAYQHVREEAVAPSTIDREISPAIDAITLKALAKPVDQRYQSASEMRADIMRALDGRSVLAPAVAAGEETQAFLPPPTTDPTPTAETSAYHTEDRQEPGRRTGLWILLGLLVLAAIAAAAFYFFNTGGDDVKQAEVPNLQGKTLDAGGAGCWRTPTSTSARRAPSPATRRRARCSGRARHRGHSSTRAPRSTSPTPADPRPRSCRRDRHEPAAGHRGARGAQVRSGAGRGRQEHRAARTRSPARTRWPGRSSPSGSTVKVYYSTGFREVPSVVGLDENAATQLLTQAGFKPSRPTPSATSPRVTVVGQDPPGGTKQPYGTVIVIQVSLGPPETTPTTPTETTPTDTTTTTPTDATTTTALTGLPTASITELGRPRLGRGSVSQRAGSAYWSVIGSLYAGTSIFESSSQLPAEVVRRQRVAAVVLHLR